MRKADLIHLQTLFILYSIGDPEENYATPIYFYFLPTSYQIINFFCWGTAKEKNYVGGRQRASQGLVKDSPTFKNFSISAIHYLTAMTCGVG